MLRRVQICAPEGGLHDCYCPFGHDVLYNKGPRFSCRRGRETKGKLLQAFAAALEVELGRVSLKSISDARRRLLDVHMLMGIVVQSASEAESLCHHITRADFSGVAAASCRY